MKYLALLVFALSPTIGIACSCVPSNDEDAYADAQVVFLAMVTETKLIEGSPFDLVHAKFEVIEKYKGEEVRVETIESTATTTCSTALLAGHKYLIYSDNNSTEHVNACTRSRWVNFVREENLLERYRNAQ